MHNLCFDIVYENLSLNIIKTYEFIISVKAERMFASKLRCFLMFHAQKSSKIIKISNSKELKHFSTEIFNGKFLFKLKKGLKFLEDCKSC